MSWQPEYDQIEPSQLGSRVCGDCWWTMVYNPPTKPFQRCAHGHLLPWFDPDTMDPERGYRAGDDDGTEDED